MTFHFALAVLVALAPALALAEDGAADPLRSSPCLAARAALDALLAQPRPRPESLAHARRSAAQACLGTQGTQRQRTGAAEPPQAVAPAAALPRQSVQAVQPPAIAPGPPALPLPRPTAITTCDPLGCWDSEGRRLNQMGPLLVGPGGMCTSAGGIVRCP